MTDDLTPTDANCGYCGHHLDSRVYFCPSCSKPFRSAELSLTPSVAPYQDTETRLRTGAPDVWIINYRKLFVDARDRIAPLKKEELVLEQSSLGNLIEIKLSEIDRKHSALIFLIDRGDGWQRVESTKPGDAPDLTWQEFSAILAIHQGRVRVDFLNKENKILASREVDLRALHKDDSIKVPVVIDPKDRIAKVIFRP